MKTVVMVPTYNEVKNIVELINELLNYPVDIVVVDDNSPDGTSEKVKELMKSHKNIHIVLRTKNRGRGSAGKDGYQYCLDHGAEAVIEMDADFSHDPKYIPQLIEGLKDADVVLGSRMVRGGKEIGRSKFRQLITSCANFYIRLLLGLRVRDCNSGFRAFRRKMLEDINVGHLFSTGPDIVQEVLFKAHLKGARIKEVPIVFKERTKGESKLGFKHLWKGYVMILKLKYLHLKGDL